MLQTLVEVEEECLSPTIFDLQLDLPDLLRTFHSRNLDLQDLGLDLEVSIILVEEIISMPTTTNQEATCRVC